ncbi:MAG: hypothetical protein FWE71_08980 [Nocardioidaceae bacterium]|nr:hypothetical protein [Nocardioidaceae bacterium]
MSQYPPPPPPPPPPGQAPYGGPPPYGGPGQPAYGFPQPRWDLGACLSWAWSKFKDNVGPMIVATLPLLVVIVVVEGANIAWTLKSVLNSREVCNADYSCHMVGGPSFLKQMLVTAGASMVISLVALVVNAGVFRASLGVADGRPLALGDVFTGRQLGKVLGTSVLVALATAIGTLLCYVPGIVIGFLLGYSVYFVVAQDLSPIAAMKASFQLTRNNLGTTVVWLIVSTLIAAAGAVVCLIGMLVTYPLVMLGYAYTFRRLTDAPVAP